MAIDFSGNAWDIISSLATLAAVVVALYNSRKSYNPKVKAIVFRFKPIVDVWDCAKMPSRGRFEFHVTNVGYSVWQFASIRIKRFGCPEKIIPVEDIPLPYEKEGSVCPLQPGKTIVWDSFDREISVQRVDKRGKIKGAQTMNRLSKLFSYRIYLVNVLGKKKRVKMSPEIIDALLAYDEFARYIELESHSLSKEDCDLVACSGGFDVGSIKSAQLLAEFCNKLGSYCGLRYGVSCSIEEAPWKAKLARVRHECFEVNKYCALIRDNDNIDDPDRTRFAEHCAEIVSYLNSPYGSCYENAYAIAECVNALNGKVFRSDYIEETCSQIISSNQNK